MPFETTANLRVISAITGTWEIWDDSPEETESGWDTLARTVVARKSSATDAVNDWAIGTNISGMNMWVVGAKARCLGADIFAVDLKCHGLVQSKDIKVTGKSTIEQQQGDDVTIPGHSHVRAVVAEAAPTVEIAYIQIGGSPPTNQVGLAGTPDYAPAVRASVWGSITNPLHHYPHNWVFQDIDFDKIPGVAVFLIKERWQYVFELSI